MARPSDASLDVQSIAINAYTTEQALVVVAPMPGVGPDDVTVELDGDRITLRAELRTDAPKDYVLKEWDYGAYARSADIAGGYGEPVVATLGNGQLVVSLTRGGPRPDAGPLVVTPTKAGSSGAGAGAATSSDT